MSAPKPEITDDDILQAFEQTGAMGLTAEVVSLSRTAVWLRVKKSKVLKAAIDAAKESHIEIALDQLHINIIAGKETSLIYYLNCQARHLGYGNFRAEDKRQDVDPEPLDPKFL